jgi:glyoxylase-like metal-dependent hydrolase (beta-lactamase superfamily II)
MHLSQLRVGSMANFFYLGKGEQGAGGFVVDPAHSAQKILEAARKADATVSHIFLTHHHYDHVDAAQEVKAATGARILAHPLSEKFLAGKVQIDEGLSDGQIIEFGAGEGVRVIHTPGHSPGGICLVVADTWLITGDTLFVGNCGRTDLPGGNPRELFDSLQKLKALPGHLIVYPGHDYGPEPFRSLAEEIRLNPVLQADSFAAFAAVP